MQCRDRVPCVAFPCVVLLACYYIVQVLGTAIPIYILYTFLKYFILVCAPFFCVPYYPKRDVAIANFFQRLDANQQIEQPSQEQRAGSGAEPSQSISTLINNTSNSCMQLPNLYRQHQKVCHLLP